MTSLDHILFCFGPILGLISECCIEFMTLILGLGHNYIDGLLLLPQTFHLLSFATHGL